MAYPTHHAPTGLIDSPQASMFSHLAAKPATLARGHAQHDRRSLLKPPTASPKRQIIISFLFLRFLLLLLLPLLHLCILPFVTSPNADICECAYVSKIPNSAFTRVAGLAVSGFGVGRHIWSGGERGEKGRRRATPHSRVVVLVCTRSEIHVRCAVLRSWRSQGGGEDAEG